MSIARLAPEDVAVLGAAPLTYPADGAATPGYRTFTRSARLPATDLAAAAEILLGWQVHRRAGLRVAASSATVVPDAVVVLSVGVGPLGLRCPCRVLRVIDTPRRRGFVYGTLPGHPESGEESFVLEQDEAGVVFTVAGFSRPASLPARLAGPVGTWLQDHVTGRYLRALTRQW